MVSPVNPKLRFSYAMAFAPSAGSSLVRVRLMPLACPMNSVAALAKRLRPYRLELVIVGCTLAVCSCIVWLLVEVRAVADAVGYIDDDATVMAVEQVGLDVKEIRRLIRQGRSDDYQVPYIAPVVPRLSQQRDLPAAPYVPEPERERVDREARFY